MRNSRTKRLTTFFSLMALFGSLLVASTAGASDGQIVSDFGTLDLILDSSGDRFEFQPISGSTVTEPLAIGQKCKADENVPPESPDVASLSASGPGNAIVGLRDHALGVKSQGDGNGEPCRRITSGETLTIGLGTDLGDKFFDSGQIA
ncbi:MAG: hypothetical protein HKO03_06470, partial [Acidimicrobiia bacterium]|nr:hypothetical protein [Acidimicrobiia bacterium]